MMNYMGIDIGTSGCKAAIFDETGQQLCRASDEYDVIFTDGGGAELDSDNVIERCFKVIKACTAQVEPASVKGLGISSQGEAFTAIGERGETLCHAMISSDMRSKSHVDSWLKDFGEERLYQITGHTAHPMFTIFKMLWLRDHRHDVWRRAHKFLCFEDLLQFRLGIDPAIGWPLAGRTMMFDVREHRWSGDILSAAELSHERLARPLSSGSIAGVIDRSISGDLSLSDDTFVVTAGHDQTCGALGAGITEPGTAMYATGSVDCLTAAFAEPIFTADLRKNNLCTYDHTVKGIYATLAYSLTGGNILKWFRDEFGAQEIEEAKRTGASAYELLLRVAGDRPSGLLVLPYFTPSGTPYFDTTTKGAVFGLRLSTTRREFIRALLEGVAFEMRLNIDILESSGCEVDELRAIGGGAKSSVWNQLKADVTGKKITTLSVTEAGCLGAAMLACAAGTEEPVQKLAARWVKPQTVITPREKNVEAYNDKFAIYLNLRDVVSRVAL